MLLNSCCDKEDEAEKLVEAEESIEKVEEKAADYEKQIKNLIEQLTAAEIRTNEAEAELYSVIGTSLSDPAWLNQNVIVQNPQKNRVTFEIDNRLVGKYISGDAPDVYNSKYVEEYFEIRQDGTIEISLTTFSGAAKYYSYNLQLTAYYMDYEDADRVYITFNLVSGKWTFPEDYGLSITFEGDSTFKSFELTQDRERLKIFKRD